MTDKIKNLLEDIQTVYESKGMVVHPNSLDKLRMEIIKLDNTIKQKNEQIQKMKGCFNCKYRNEFVESKCGECDCYSKWEIKEQ
jgi:hypothetical protein